MEGGRGYESGEGGWGPGGEGRHRGRRAGRRGRLLEEGGWQGSVRRHCEGKGEVRMGVDVG